MKAFSLVLFIECLLVTLCSPLSAQEEISDPVVSAPWCDSDHVYTDKTTGAPGAIAATIRAYRGAIAFMQCDYGEYGRVFVRMREPKAFGVCRLYDQEIDLLDEKSLSDTLANQPLRKVSRGYAPTGWAIDDPYSPAIERIAFGKPNCPPLDSHDYVRVDGTMTFKDFVAAFKKINRLLHRLQSNSQTFDVVTTTIRAPEREKLRRLKIAAMAHALRIAYLHGGNRASAEGYDLSLSDIRVGEELFDVHVDPTLTKFDRID